MADARFQPITEVEANWVEAQINAGRELVGQYAPGFEQLSLEALDAAWAAWLATSSADTDEINRVINAVGIPFGAFLTDTGEFEWCIATDDWGTDLAVRALPGSGDILVYPADFVSKRWESRTTGFLAKSYLRIMEQVAGTRQEWDSAAEK